VKSTDAHSLSQAKADLLRSNEARDLLEQAVEEMKRELIGAAAMSSERAALQDEVPAACTGGYESNLTRRSRCRLHRCMAV
jgi:hypothetical protein